MYIYILHVHQYAAYAPQTNTEHQTNTTLFSMHVKMNQHILRYTSSEFIDSFTWLQRFGTSNSQSSCCCSSDNSSKHSCNSTWIPRCNTLENFHSWKQNMGVCKNNGTPKSSILIWFSIINHPFWDTPIFGNTHMEVGKMIFLFNCSDF